MQLPGPEVCVTVVLFCWVSMDGCQFCDGWGCNNFSAKGKHTGRTDRGSSINSPPRDRREARPPKHRGANGKHTDRNAVPSTDNQ